MILPALSAGLTSNRALVAGRAATSPAGREYGALTLLVRMIPGQALTGGFRRALTWAPADRCQSEW
jgi:hypothetical protein